LRGEGAQLANRPSVPTGGGDTDYICRDSTRQKNEKLHVPRERAREGKRRQWCQPQPHHHGARQKDRLLHHRLRFDLFWLFVVVVIEVNISRLVAIIIPLRAVPSFFSVVPWVGWSRRNQQRLDFTPTKARKKKAI
jgi:hypothetical protein